MRAASVLLAAAMLGGVGGSFASASSAHALTSNDPVTIQGWMDYRYYQYTSAGLSLCHGDGRRLFGNEYKCYYKETPNGRGGVYKNWVLAYWA